MSLYSFNSPPTFWKLFASPEPTADEWMEAVLKAAPVLPEGARQRGDEIEELLEGTLGEGQFGPGRLRLGPSKWLYYALKPLLPRRLTRGLRRAHRGFARRSFTLNWPIETRYTDFMLAVVSHLMASRGESSLPFIHFWPHQKAFSLVLTHDVESLDGCRNVLNVAALEERLGFRSCFNFIPERYAIDLDLLAELDARGFEIGVHDLNHDGRLFSSKRVFDERARRINRHVAGMGAAGFRSAMTHRNAEWLQELTIEYDLSFFDTDPYEPMPGGSMSIWPFFIGRFVELPTTLVQDYTLTAVLQHRTPKLWTEKVDYIAANCGMALLNTHPDYLTSQFNLRLYHDFLNHLATRGDVWRALPREVARWWRTRAQAIRVEELHGGTVGYVQALGGTLRPGLKVKAG